MRVALQDISAHQGPTRFLPHTHNCLRLHGELEREHDVEGKYTIGLMMQEFAACDEDEGVITMALTVVSRLVETHGLRYEDIGMVQVGSESLLDRSKSMKTELMALIEVNAYADLEGVDYYGASASSASATPLPD